MKNMHKASKPSQDHLTTELSASKSSYL